MPYYQGGRKLSFAYIYTKEHVGIYILCVCVRACVCVCVRVRAHCTAPRGTENARAKPKISCPCVSHDGNWGVELHSLLISALDAIKWPASRPGCFTPRDTDKST
jgi:hypothetical protein